MLPHRFVVGVDHHGVALKPILEASPVESLDIGIAFGGDDHLGLLVGEVIAGIVACH